MLPVDAEPNRLNDQVLVRYYDRDWREIAIDRHAPPIPQRGAGRARAQNGPSHRRRFRQRSAIRWATGCAIVRRFRAAAAERQDPAGDRGRRHRRLSAAWRLDKRGFRDFVLLEMENAGRRQRALGRERDQPLSLGRALCAGAGPKATLVRELFEELGVLRDGVWDERYLCFSPQERLFLHGSWQEGIEPADRAYGAGPRSSSGDFDAAHRTNSAPPASSPFRWSCGAKPSPLDQHLDGRLAAPANASIRPICAGTSTTPAATTTARWPRDTSAWAGIHYFASREPEEKGPLTWPEGNGWITQTAARKAWAATCAPARMVHRIARDGRKLRVLHGDTEYIADARHLRRAHVSWRPMSCEGAAAASTASSTRPGSPPI